MNEVKTRLTQYMENIPYDKLTGNEIELWGCYYKAPTTGVTGVLRDCSTRFKYDFAKGEVILVDIKGAEVFRKAVPLDVFIGKQYAWLNVIKREARLVLNLDEEENSEVCEEVSKRKVYYGYIDEDGDVIDMRNAVEGGIGAEITDVDSMAEELGDFEVDEEGNIYQLFEERLPKSSEPEEGLVYWNKKHDTAYIVVAVYPDQKDAKKQVSYWNDEGKRLTCSIEDFKKNMVPSKDKSDFEIFEECEDDQEDDVSEE